MSERVDAVAGSGVMLAVGHASCLPPSMRVASADSISVVFFFFQAEDGIRDYKVTGVQTCALPILLSFRRAPLLSVLSVTTIAFSLFTLGLFGLVAINLREALRGLEERVEIVAFVLRGTPAETITPATQDIAAFPEVKDVAFVTEEQALARARQELVGVRDAYADLQVDP